MSVEDSSDIPDGYCLNGRDQVVVAAAIQLVEKILQANFITPVEMVSMAKVLHVLKRLPKRSSAISVSTSLSGPTRVFGKRRIYHFWQVNVVEEQIEISSGGHFYRESTGGDTFTCMEWNAQPGLEAEYGDYFDQLQIVVDTQPFDKEIAAIDLAQPGYTLSVTDQDNPLLEDIADTDHDETEGKAELVEAELTEAEQKLATMGDQEEGRRQGQFYANPSDVCDFCGCNLRERSFFVDGRLRGQITFASMCAECFLEKGDGVGWGKGQIYQRGSNGKWLLVAGFPPKEQQ
jgi:hypothetical protein